MSILSAKPHTISPSSYSFFQSANQTQTAYLIQINSTPQANPFYLSFVQPELSSKMRSILIDWLFEISSDFYFKRETCHLAISLLDRYLSLCRVKRSSFQLLGVACLIISCKVEEKTVPKIEDFLKSAGNIYSIKEFREIESEILKTIQWKVIVPNSFTVTDWLCFQWDSFVSSNCQNSELLVKDARGFMKYRDVVELLDICVMDIDILKFNLRIISACCLYLVLFKYIKRGRMQDRLKWFMDFILVFLNASLGIESFDQMIECGMFMNKYLEVPHKYDFPKVCRTGLSFAGDLEIFVYQTYNPLNIDAMK